MSANEKGALFLDTNVLKRMVPFDGPLDPGHFTMLRIVAQAHALRLAVPALVRDEYLHQYREHLTEIVRDYRKASEKLLGLPDWQLAREHPSPPAVDHFVKERTKHLQRRFGTFEECDSTRAFTSIQNPNGYTGFRRSRSR